jgi:cytochrome P450
MYQTKSAEAVPVGPLPDHFDLGGEQCGIRWVSSAVGTSYWLISDYKLARKVLADKRFGRSEAAGNKAPKISTYNASQEAIISLDGAEHARIRQLIAPAFTERRIAEQGPFVTRLVEELLDGLADQQRPADFISHVAASLPFEMMCHLLGVPSDDRPIFSSWVNVLFRLVGDIDDSRQHSVSLARYMVKLVADKSRNPGSDLISTLLHSTEEEGRLTNRELVTLCLSLLMAGYDSTVDQITLSLLTVLLDQPLMRTLISNPELIAPAVEEFLRLNPAPYMSFPRMALETVTLGDTAIEQGQLVAIFIMASNRDPSVFALPEEVGLEGSVPAHLTFGHGLHRCVGAPLARLQLTTLLTGLLRRFPNMQLAEDVSDLDWKQGMATRGITHMYVTW